MKRTKDGADPFALGILAFFGLAIGGVTLVVLYLYPVMMLTCRYAAPDQVDCQVREKMVGLITTAERSIPDVKEAYVTSETYERLRPRPQDVDSVVHKLILGTPSGAVELEGLDEFGGIFVNRSVETINNYLLARSDEALVIRQATWVPLLVGGFFFLVALVLLYTVVDAVLRRKAPREKG